MLAVLVDLMEVVVLSWAAVAIHEGFGLVGAVLLVLSEKLVRHHGVVSVVNFVSVLNCTN